MNKRSLAIGLFIIFATTTSIFAQQHLSLEQCRKLAIENNNALKIASEQERIAYYEKKDAITKFFPEISFAGGYFRNQKNLNLINSASIPNSIDIPPILGLPGTSIPIDGFKQELLNATELDIKNIWVGGFNLTQPVFMGGKIIAYNDLRSYAEELAKTMKDSKMTDVIVEVDNAYWQVVSISNKKELATSYVELLTKMNADIAAMEEEGLVTKADRLTVNVKLNEAEMTLTKAENGLSLAKMLLSQICGLDVSDAITLKDENTKNIPTAEDMDAIPNLDEAMMNRPEIKSLQLATKIYEKKEKIALAEFMPNVALTANYIWTNPNMFDGFQNKLAGMWNVGVLVKVPFNIASNSAKLNAAKAETRIKQYELAEAQEKIKLQVNQSAYKLTEANKKLSSAKKNTEKADENLRYAKVGFEEGVIPASDVLGAHTAWLAAHSEMIDAQIDLVLCRIYLNKALGRKL